MVFMTVARPRLSNLPCVQCNETKGGSLTHVWTRPQRRELIQDDHSRLPRQDHIANQVHVVCYDCLKQESLKAMAEGIDPYCPGCRVEIQDGPDFSSERLIHELENTQNLVTSRLAFLMRNITMRSLQPLLMGIYHRL